MAGNDQQRSLTQDFIFREKIISINHTNSHIEIKNSNEKYRLQRQMGWKIFQQPINNLLDKVRKILEFGFKAHCSMNRASTKAILAFCTSQQLCLCYFSPKKISQYDGRCQSYVLGIDTTMHYGIRAMGAMSLRISEFCLSFSPHPNISDGNFNLDHHFFCMQIFQMK